MTPAALKQAALERIGVVPGGSDAPADDVAVMTRKYTGIHAQLVQRKMVTWAITEDLPDEAQEPLIAMLAFSAAGEYGVPDPRYSRLRLEGSLDDEQPSLAERQLRKALKGPVNVSSPARTEFY